MNATKRKDLFSKDFTLVAIGQIISIFGNQILRYALPLYILNQTGSAALFGTVMAFSAIPMILLYPIGGIIADRVNKRNVMVVLDFCTALLIILFYLLIGKIDIVPLVAITMIILCGIQGAYQPAVKASVPVLLSSEQLMRGNSIIDVISSLSSMVGPVMGGILYSFFGLTPILYVSIACFILSAFMEIFIEIPFLKREKSGNVFAMVTNDLKESFGFIIKKQPSLWKTSVIFSVANLFLVALLLIGTPVIIIQHLQFEPDTATRLYGFAMGIIAGGAILGGVLAGVFAKKLTTKASPMLLGGCALFTLISGIALHTLDSSMAIYFILAIMSGLLLILHTIFQIQVMTVLGILTPKDLIGKVISCFMCIVLSTIPLGQFIYGIVFDNIGSRTYLPFYAAALIMFGVTVLTRRVFGAMENMVKSDM